METDIFSQIFSLDHLASSQKINIKEILLPLIKRSYKTPDINFRCSVNKFKKKFKTDIDETIFDVLNLFKPVDDGNIFLCGGKVIDAINGTQYKDSNNDYDIFFTSSETFNLTYKYLDACCEENILIKISSLPHIEEYIYRRNEKEIKIQIIKSIFSSIDDILESFDIRCCAIGYSYNNKQLYWKSGAIKDIKRKEARALSISKTGLSLLIRLTKYAQKGYSVSSVDLCLGSLFCIDRLFDIDISGRLSFLKSVSDRKYQKDRSVHHGYETWLEELHGQEFGGTQEQELTPRVWTM